MGNDVNLVTDQGNLHALRGVVIIGAGGHATVVMDACSASGVDVAAFVDTTTGGSEGMFLGRPLLSGERALPDAVQRYRNHAFFVALGRNMARHAWTRGLLDLGLPIATITHPAAVVSRTATIAAGCFVAAGAVVGPQTLLDHAAIVNTAATIDHHGRLSAGAHLAPGSHLGGSVSVGEYAWVGIGASARDNISIGAAALLGCGAVATASVPARRVFMGVPARDQRECRATDPHMSSVQDLAEIGRVCSAVEEAISAGNWGRP